MEEIMENWELKALKNCLRDHKDCVDGAYYWLEGFVQAIEEKKKENETTTTL